MSPAATFLTTWTPVEPVPAIAILAAGAGYLWATRRIARRWPGAPWPGSRTAWFLAGLALVWVAILGPFGAYDDTFFWAHMVQHIILMMVAAPLLMLGAPVTLILRAATPGVRRAWIVPVLRSRVVGTLAHPFVGWVIFAGVLLGAHFTPFYDYALYHPWIHNYVEHPVFLSAGMLMYWSMLGIDPGPVHVPHSVRILLLFLMMPVEALTGFVIYAARHLMYTFYAHVERPFGPGPLADQHWGGMIMWAGGMLVDLGWILVAARAWYHHEQRQAARLDARLDARRAAAGTPAGDGSTGAWEPQRPWWVSDAEWREFQDSR